MDRKRASDASGKQKSHNNTLHCTLHTADTLPPQPTISHPPLTPLPHDCSACLCLSANPTTTTTHRIMDGELKGSDTYGNQYYENLHRPPGRQRFIIYRGWGKQNDPSQIPAEWHHWLHSVTDRTPVERPPVLHAYQRSAVARQLSGHGMEGRYAPQGSYLRTEPKQHTSYNVWEKETVKEQDNSGTQPRV